VIAVEQMMSNHYYYLFQLIRRSVGAVPPFVYENNKTISITS